MTEARKALEVAVADGQDVARPGPGPQERDRPAPGAEIGGREAGQRIQAAPDRAERPHPRTDRMLETATNNAKDLRERVARLTSVVREAGLSDDASPDDGPESAPPVQGEIARVDAQNRQFEITIGSDDGLVGRPPALPLPDQAPCRVPRQGHRHLHRPGPGRDPRHRHDRPGQESKGGGHCLVYDPPEGLAVRGPPPRAGGGRPGVFVQAPRSDIYVAMLGVALGAMILGCLLLFLVSTARSSRRPSRPPLLRDTSPSRPSRKIPILYTCHHPAELLQSHRPLELAPLPSFGRTVARRLLLKPCHVTSAFRSGEHGGSRPAT